MVLVKVEILLTFCFMQITLRKQEKKRKQAFLDNINMDLTKKNKKLVFF